MRAARSCVHGRAEAGRCGLRAVDRHDERGGSSRLIDRVDVRAAGEDAILNLHRGQFTGADAQKRVLRRCFVRAAHLPAAVGSVGGCDGCQRGEQITLPRMRTDHVAEIRGIVPSFESVLTGFLAIGPAARQFIHRFDLVIDDGFLIDLRADYLIAVVGQHRDQTLQFGGRQKLNDVAVGHCRSCHDRGLPSRRIAAGQSDTGCVSLNMSSSCSRVASSRCDSACEM